MLLKQPLEDYQLSTEIFYHLLGFCGYVRLAVGCAARMRFTVAKKLQQCCEVFFRPILK
jgi:hypothetical protein